jgi:hypothetical protein
MSGRQVVGLITFVAVSATLGLYSTYFHFEMIDQVNTKLSTEQQFSALGWHYFKFRRLLIEYRRLYPSGTLDKRLRFLGGIGFGQGLVAAWLLGFPLLGILWLGVAGGFGLWLVFRR